MDPGVLAARVAALEARVDELSRRLFSDLAPLAPVPADQLAVGADLVELAAKGGDVGLAKAILEHVKRTGADLIVAEDAVRRAAGLPPRAGA